MEPIILPIIIGIIIALVPSTLLAVMKRKWKKNDIEKKEEVNNTKANTEAIREMKRSIWRLNKTVLIMTKILDDQTSKYHPELASSLEDIATELLKESDKG